MAYNDELTERVRSALADVPNMTEKKMFGSIGFMVNGKLCVAVGKHKDHQMMIRIDPDVHEQALKKKGARPAIMQGREYKSYIFLLEEGLRSKEDLDFWITLALDCNKKLKQTKKPGV